MSKTIKTLKLCEKDIQTIVDTLDCSEIADYRDFLNKKRITDLITEQTNIS